MASFNTSECFVFWLLWVKSEYILRYSDTSSNSDPNNLSFMTIFLYKLVNFIVYFLIEAYSFEFF